MCWSQWQDSVPVILGRLNSSFFVIIVYIVILFKSEIVKNRTELWCRTFGLCWNRSYYNQWLCACLEWYWKEQLCWHELPYALDSNQQGMIGVSIYICPVIHECFRWIFSITYGSVSFVPRGNSWIWIKLHKKKKKVKDQVEEIYCKLIKKEKQLLISKLVRDKIMFMKSINRNDKSAFHWQ